MATNPFFSNKTSPNGATAPNDSLNESYKRYFRGYNKFNLTRTFFNTERYADINLVDVIEGVEGDKLSIANKHLIRSYTFKAPKMFDIYKKKTYFAVNNKAILPINWEKVYKQPNKGDDVTTDVNCVSNFYGNFESFFRSLGESDSWNNPTIEHYNLLWRYVFILESIFSNGSLLASMNAHLSSSILVSDGSTFDKWLEDTLSFYNGSPYVGNEGRGLCCSFPSISPKLFQTWNVGTSDILVSNRVMFDMMRTFSDFNVYFVDNEAYINGYNYLLNRLDMLDIRYNAITEDDTINLSRLIAYQLACVQFYTRDSVDNIYTSEMFLDNAKSVALGFISVPPVWPQFIYNGTKYDYDVFSGHIINIAFSKLLQVHNNSQQYEQVLSAYNYLHMIFFFRKSLRYGDYFVGAKTLPYAPMDVTADVVGQGVSALDITRSIIAQRFANAVERVSNTWKDYLKGVTGGVASPNVLEPRFLASSTSNVDGFEVENTADAQFTNDNISTILKSGNSNYVYEIEVGEPCIIIGVSTYEVPRVYSATVDRFFRHTDRFNMFNKFFQNIGDQEITQNERNSAFSPSSIFGYTPRHMEYKQRYPIASGGFVDGLKGYTFITDNIESAQNDIDLGDSTVITSYYLRNRNSEFDRFYASLTGLSLANYFHFQVKYTNICHATRQMEYSPSIL